MSTFGHLSTFQQERPETGLLELHTGRQSFVDSLVLHDDETNTNGQRRAVGESTVHMIGSSDNQGNWHAARQTVGAARKRPRGRFYLSGEAANHVYQLDRGGKVLRTIGRLDLQQPGSYDPQTLMAPGKLATWLDSEGHDRILIVENAGPIRVAEWNADGEPVAPHITGSAGHFGDLALRDQRPPGFR